MLMTGPMPKCKMLFSANSNCRSLPCLVSKICDSYSLKTVVTCVIVLCVKFVQIKYILHAILS